MIIHDVYAYDLYMDLYAYNQYVIHKNIPCGEYIKSNREWGSLKIRKKYKKGYITMICSIRIVLKINLK